MDAGATLNERRESDDGATIQSTSRVGPIVRSSDGTSNQEPEMTTKITVFSDYI